MTYLFNQDQHEAGRKHGVKPPTGFSLVEVLVVIAIIGVLVALLVVALGGATNAVQRAAITAEVAAISQGLNSMTTQTSADYPPDFSTNPPGVTNQQIINQYMSRLFRNRNPQTDVPRQRDGRPMAALFENLDPAEAVWFWMRGFSSDPQNPLFGPLSIRDQTLVERAAFMELDKERLRDEDQDGFLEYYPEFGNQMPYVYYVASNYVRTFVSPNANMKPLRFSGMNAAAALLPPRPYLSTVTAAVPNPWIRQQYAAPDTFQIIACGLDGEFGPQIPIDSIPPQPAAGTSPPGTAGQHIAFAYPNGPYPERAHLDNVTNFAEGTLEGKLP